MQSVVIAFSSYGVSLRWDTLGTGRVAVSAGDSGLAVPAA